MLLFPWLLNHFQTHNVALASTVAQFVVCLQGSGKISAQGPIAEVVRNSKGFIEELNASGKSVHKASDVVDPQPNPSNSDPSTGKLTVPEEMEVGHVSRNACE